MGDFHIIITTTFGDATQTWNLFVIISNSSSLKKNIATNSDLRG